MSLRNVLVVLILAAVAAGGVWVYFDTRNPWAAVNAPQPFLLTSVTAIDAETQAPVDLTIDRDDPFSIAGFAVQIEEQMAEGYGLFDPDAQTFAVWANGQAMVAPYTVEEAPAPFDVSQTGGGPAFATYTPSELSVTVTLPADEFWGVIYRMHLDAVEDASAQIAAQEQIAADWDAVLAAWRAEMDGVAAIVDDGPSFLSETYDLALPGGQATVTLPLWAYAGLNVPGFPRTEINGPGGFGDGFRLLAMPPDALDEAFIAEQDYALRDPEAELYVLHQTEDTLISVRHEGAASFLHRAQIGSLGYLMFAEVSQADRLRTLLAIADSLRSDPPAPAAFLTDPDFDAGAWLSETYHPFVVSPQTGDGLAAEIAELLETSRLMGQLHTTATFRWDIAESEDAFPLYVVDGACTLSLEPVSSLADRHDAAPPDMLFGFAIEDIAFTRIALFVESGDFAAEASAPVEVPHPAPETRIGTWLLDGPTRALGRTEHLHVGYLTRPLDDFTLICGVSANHPIAIPLALAEIDATDLPAVPDLPHEARDFFRAFYTVQDFAPGLYQVIRESGEQSRIILADGMDLIDRAYFMYRAYPESGVFEARTEDDLHTLYDFGGRQLLPLEYDDIQEQAPGEIWARQDQTWFRYLVADGSLTEVE